MISFLSLLLLILPVSRACGTAIPSELKGIVYPLVQEQISSPFGSRRHSAMGKMEFHQGIDLISAHTDVLSIGDGIVVYAGPCGSYGNLVVIKHGSGYTSHYAHLSTVTVRVGESVTRATLIGFIGATGRATGDHLHFEVRRYGCGVDPFKLFPALGKMPRG